MSTCRTIKVKSTHPASQGAFVEINEEDFDEKQHELYKEPKGAAAKEASKEPAAPKDDGGKALADMTATELKAALDDVGVAYKANASKADLLALAEDFRQNGKK